MAFTWAARTFVQHAAENALARAAPRLSAALTRLGGATGRGPGRDGEAGAAYFDAVFDDYRVVAKEAGIASDLYEHRHILELGPGDTRSIALLARLCGAKAWEGYDAFDIQSRRSDYTDAIYGALSQRHGATLADARVTLETCKVHASESSLRSGGPRFDLVISRAVLEHVRDLRDLFRIISSVVTPDCVLVHKVDLRSHGLEHDHELDFLRFPERLYALMTSHRDLPNRERLPAYLGLAEEVGLRTVYAATTHVVDRGHAEAVRRSLATPFRSMPSEVLRVLGLWLVQVGPEHPLVASAKALTTSSIGPAPHAKLSHY